MTPSRTRHIAVLALGFAVVALSRTPAVETLPYDHIHINVPYPDSAFAWYLKNFGGKVNDESPNRINYGTTRVMFLQSATAQPSAGSAIDHIGFSVADIDATFRDFAARGVKVTSAVRDVPGLFKLGFIEDPWGTRIEVVQDSALLGLHHIHMRAPVPDSTFAWLLAHFGGERAKLKGRLDAIKYSAPGFSDMWILVQAGAATPSTGRAIDHIGWRVKELNAKVAELKSGGVTIETEPKPLVLGNKSTIFYSYLAGPSGARIELVQR